MCTDVGYVCKACKRAWGDDDANNLMGITCPTTTARQSKELVGDTLVVIHIIDFVEAENV
jgi:hypothetical protein